MRRQSVLWNSVRRPRPPTLASCNWKRSALASAASTACRPRSTSARSVVFSLVACALARPTRSSASSIVVFATGSHIPRNGKQPYSERVCRSSDNPLWLANSHCVEAQQSASKAVFGEGAGYGAQAPAAASIGIGRRRERQQRLGLDGHDHRVEMVVHFFQRGHLRALQVPNQFGVAGLRVVLGAFPSLPLGDFLSQASIVVLLVLRVLVMLAPENASQFA